MATGIVVERDLLCAIEMALNQLNDVALLWETCCKPGDVSGRRATRACYARCFVTAS